MPCSTLVCFCLRGEQMRFIVRRFIFYVLALWGAVTLNFFLPRLMPGNPVQMLLAKFKDRVNPQAIVAYSKTFGLNNQGSLWHQYFAYIGNLLHGQLGISIGQYPEPVYNVLMQAFPWTLFLMGLSTVISFILGTGAGILSAWYRGSLFDSFAPTVFTLTSAFPYFWFALLLIYLFAFRLPWFPLAHAFSQGTQGWSWGHLPDILYHAILPAFAVIVSSIGGWLLSMRNNMVSALTEEYITVARAKGLSTRRIILRYAARNAILPNITGFAMSLGFVLSGALVTEVVFSYPGLGFTMMQAVSNVDYPVIQGALLLIAVAVLCANFVADLVYVNFDPRVRKGR